MEVDHCTGMDYVYVVDKDFDTADYLLKLSNPECGGTAIFIGDYSNGFFRHIYSCFNDLFNPCCLQELPVRLQDKAISL